MVTQLRGARQRNITRALALFAVLGAPWPALGDDARADARRRAAAAYDQGVKHFESAAYAEAARAFLEADALAPSSDALTNAIVAGRKANEHLLVATAAERVLSRSGLTDNEAARAREALAEASLQLARLDLACQPAPCNLTLDGVEVPGGKRFVQPGVVEIVARGGGRERVERFKLAAGANYSINVKIDEPEASPLVTPAPRDSAAPRAATAAGGVFFVDWEGAGSDERALRLGARGRF